MLVKDLRMKVLMLVALMALLSGTAIYPPMVGGEFEFKVLPVIDFDVDGVAVEPVPKSIGIVPLEGGDPVACVATPDPTRSCEPGACPGTAEPYTVMASISVTGVRQAFKAHSYMTSDCSIVDAVTMSGPSENTGYTYPGMSPRPPDMS
jgi:hypothetical protein